MRTNLARRAFIKGAPAALATVAAPTAALASSGIAKATATETASPALVDAHTRLANALSELKEAKSSLEWLVDEWRHLWPHAPEELLGGANADTISSYKSTAERDIAGNFLRRDTSDLTKRFNAKQRRENPRTCFLVWTSREMQESLDNWSRRKPSGRTEKALARAIAERDRAIEYLTRRRDLALRYEAETKRLREASRVDDAHERIGAATRQVKSICTEISDLPARNLKDLMIKAEALEAGGTFDMNELAGISGIFGDMARFVKSTMALGAEV